MPHSLQALALLIQMHLTPDERAQGVAYAAESVISAGTSLAFPGVSISVPKDAFIAFIDRDPLANWGHPARYLLIAADNDTVVTSVEARLPPFASADGLRWRLVYRAPSVPDAAVAVPR